MILILQDAFDPKKFLSVDHHAVFLVKVRIHNHVEFCLIFQTQKTKPLPFPDAAERLRILLPACIARPAPEANRTLVFTWSWDSASRQYVIGCGPVLMPDRENPQQDALRQSSDRVATIPFALESHLATGRKPGPRVNLPQSSSSMHYPSREFSAPISLSVTSSLSSVRDTATRSSIPSNGHFCLTETILSPPTAVCLSPGRNGTRCADTDIHVPFNVCSMVQSIRVDALIGFTRKPCNCASCTSTADVKPHRLIVEECRCECR